MTSRLKMAGALILLCMACSNVKETPKGLKYTVVKKGDGVTVKPGQYLIASIMFKDPKDSVWLDTRKAEFPAPIMVPDTTAATLKRETGVEEIFRLLSKGDSITFKIAAGELYEKTFHQPLPPKMDKAGEFFFTIGVTNIIGQEDYMKLQKAMMEKRNESAKKEAAVHLAKDTVSIDSILTTKNITALKTPSGLRYVITKKGSGPLVANGNTAMIDYAGYLANGKCFDTNIESVAKANGLNRPGAKSYPVKAGALQVIPGMDEMLLTMNKGESLTVYIPSSLGYGPQAMGKDIPSNSILVFDLTVADIKTK